MRRKSKRSERAKRRENVEMCDTSTDALKKRKLNVDKSEGKSEGSKPTIETRLSLKKIVEVNKSLTKEQKAAVRSIGLGGLLHLNCTKLKRELCRYVIDRFDADKMTLTVHGHEIKVTASDVARVLGLKDEGEPVPVEGNRDDLDHLAGIFEIRHDGIALGESIERVLTPSIGHGDEFKKLYTVYAIGYFLSPSTKPVVKVAVAECLKNVGALGRYNWAEFVMNSLCDALKNRGKYVCGCVFFLKVLFLEYCLPLEQKAPPHDISPCIKYWTTRKLLDRMEYYKNNGGYESPSSFNVIKNRFEGCGEEVPGRGNRVEEGDEVLGRGKIEGDDVQGRGKRVEEEDDVLGRVKKVEEGLEQLRGKFEDLKRVVKAELDEGFEKLHQKIMQELGKERQVCEECMGKTKGNEDHEAMSENGAGRRRKSSECGSSSSISVKVIDSCKPTVSRKLFWSKPLSVQEKVQHGVGRTSPLDSEGVKGTPGVADEVVRGEVGNQFGQENDMFTSDDSLAEYLFSPERNQLEIVVLTFEAYEVDRKNMRRLPNDELSSQIIDAFACQLALGEGQKDRERRKWYLPSICSSWMLGKNYELSNFINGFYGPNNLTGLVCDCDEIYLPVNVDNSHWYMLFIDVKNESFVICDTLRSYKMKDSINEQVSRLLECFEGLFKVLNFPRRFTKFKRLKPKLPTQGNGKDCGLYVCLMMEHNCEVKSLTEPESSRERRKLAFKMWRCPHNVKNRNV